MDLRGRREPRFKKKEGKSAMIFACGAADQGSGMQHSIKLIAQRLRMHMVGPKHVLRGFNFFPFNTRCTEDLSTLYTPGSDRLR